MSTWIYLACGSHEPPLIASGESGQHEYDLPQLKADIARWDFIVDAYVDGVRWPDWFRNNTAAFLAGHRDCRIGIKNEYGDWYDPTADEDERLPEPVWIERNSRDAEVTE